MLEGGEAFAEQTCALGRKTPREYPGRQDSANTPWLPDLPPISYRAQLHGLTARMNMKPEMLSRRRGERSQHES